MNIIKRTKCFLWSIGLLKEDTCPLCKEKMLPHYDYDDGFYLWTCENQKCEATK